jgi:acyl carrier protein
VAEVGDRLVRCFSSVFPTLTEEEVRAADVESLVTLDSLAGVTLVAVIDEEFGVEIDLKGLLELGTFHTIEQHLLKQSGASVLPNEQETK